MTRRKEDKGDKEEFCISLTSPISLTSLISPISPLSSALHLNLPSLGL
ncbi:MAG: hypothetical protein SWY16_10860 [Cyanobacteriota bacterium]|nr:hypothetical protein [Cyanobacteriota bacterium]